MIVVSADTSMNASVYTLETSRFKEAFNILNNNSLNVSEFTNNKIKGTVNADKDATLICSIPYDKGWSVYIDGKKVETNDIYGAFISVHVPAGEHNITLKYTPVNLILGCIITSLCIIILIGIYFFKRMCRMNVISTDSWPVLIQELICEDDVILMDRRKQKHSPYMMMILILMIHLCHLMTSVLMSLMILIILTAMKAIMLIKQQLYLIKI